ncbi:MAG: hypothetical protein WBM08_08110 [Prochlorococcaceae cyanobacterium]
MANAIAYAQSQRLATGLMASGQEYNLAVLGLPISGTSQLSLVEDSQLEFLMGECPEGYKSQCVLSAQGSLYAFWAPLPGRPELPRLPGYSIASSMEALDFPAAPKIHEITHVGQLDPRSCNSLGITEGVVQLRQLENSTFQLVIIAG